MAHHVSPVRARSKQNLILMQRKSHVCLESSPVRTQMRSEDKIWPTPGVPLATILQVVRPVSMCSLPAVIRVHQSRHSSQTCALSTTVDRISPAKMPQLSLHIAHLRPTRPQAYKMMFCQAMFCQPSRPRPGPSEVSRDSHQARP